MASAKKDVTSVKKKKRKVKYSGIGGQAVMEGIMMRGNDRYAVAVRKPNHQIEVVTGDCKSGNMEKGIMKVPFVRGIVAFVDSLELGMKTLSLSSDFYEEEDEDAFYEWEDRINILNDLIDAIGDTLGT